MELVPERYTKADWDLLEEGKRLLKELEGIENGKVHEESKGKRKKRKPADDGRSGEERRPAKPSTKAIETHRDRRRKAADKRLDRQITAEDAKKMRGF